MYPIAFDTDDNLYLVKDALWATLAVDHYPNQNIIVADGNLDNFPPKGIITLVDQCASPNERATSFYYNKKTNNEFLGLRLISEKDSFKPKKLTKITMQVMSDHREALKQSILDVEKFLGARHAVDNTPKGKTIFGRINFLKKVLYVPKAWFEANVTVGIAPFTVKFKFTGTGNDGPIGDVIYTWKFGDDEIQSKDANIEKTFLIPGNHDVSLTIKNDYGEDTVKFVDMIKVKGQPPEEATVNFVGMNTAKIRTPINQPVQIEIPQKLAEDNKKTLAGELVDPSTKKKLDAIKRYTWNLGDSLPHANLPTTKALYTVGGLYNIEVKTETELGSYRITTIPDAIDVVEITNLWLWSINGKRIRSHEFGLISEVFKTSNNTFDLQIDDSFISNDRQKFEFWRNNGSAHDNEASGNNGTCLLYWASGRNAQESSAIERINTLRYNGFTDTYTTKNSLASRPWNWVSFVSNKDIYFILGNTLEKYPTVSMTNQDKVTYNFKNATASTEHLSYTKYLSGATDLMKHPDVFTENYDTPHGHFAAYRTTWKGSTGYLLRNSKLGDNLSFQDFYKTSGTLGNPFNNLVKLPDLPGDGHKEGDLVAMEHGVYFFDSFGGAYCFNDTTMVWETVTSHNKVAKNELNKLLAASHGNKSYISMDDDVFFKFNETDMSYTTLPGKPADKQWLVTIF